MVVAVTITRTDFTAGALREAAKRTAMPTRPGECWC
jgi:hypothetical protein